MNLVMTQSIKQSAFNFLAGTKFNTLSFFLFEVGHLLLVSSAGVLEALLLEAWPRLWNLVAWNLAHVLFNDSPFSLLIAPHVACPA